jgi:hypothetical protein
MLAATTTQEDPMASWGEFAAAAPAIAEAGRRLIYRDEKGSALLSTVRGDGLPRIHPISVAIREDRLVAVLLRSAKATDLVEDGRYALHATHDPAVPNEFLVRGRARLIDDAATRSRLTSTWYFGVAAEESLFEFLIEHAVLGERGSATDWPPHYSSWRSPAG